MPVKVSVIVPAYNVQEYIEECLDSLLAQTFSEAEIIVVNDGSTDRTAERVRAYEHPRIRLIEQENGGLSAARNTGIAEAQGEFVLCVDSDDCLHPETLAACYEEAQKHKTEAVSFDGFDFFNTDTKGERVIRKTPYFDRSRKLKEGLYSGKEFFRQTATRHAILVGAPFYFLKRELFLQIPFKEGLLHEDVYFHYELLTRLTSICYLPRFFYERRIRPGSITASVPSVRSFLSYREICLNIQEKYNRADAFYRPLWQRVIRKNMLQVGKLAGIYRRSDRRERKQVRRIVRQILKNGNFLMRTRNLAAYTAGFFYGLSLKNDS